jgi:hypothetical protein
MQSLFADPFLPAPPTFAAPTAPLVRLPREVRDSVGLDEVVVDPERAENPSAADVTAFTKAEVRGSADSLLPFEDTSPPTTQGSAVSAVGLELLAVPPVDEDEEAVELASDPMDADPLLSSIERDELTEENALDPKSGHADEDPEEVAEEEELVEATRESVKVGESPNPSSADS